MGTGIVSTLLHNFPYHGRWLVYLSYIAFALNVVLFLLFCSVTMLRYILYPYLWKAMIQHPQQSLFLGTFPMALATIVNMVVFTWSSDTWRLAWALWWIDAVLAVISCFCLPFIIMAVHQQHIETMTAIWFIPVVAPIVASATGGLVAGIIPPAHQEEILITVITSYALLALGLPLAMCVLVIYFLRLTTAKLPPQEAIVSTFIPTGPLGMGGFSLITLGKISMALFEKTHTLPASKLVYAGDFVYLLGFCVAFMLWGFGLVWLFFALATIVRTPRFPFNMGWWGFVFPLGVYATTTNALAQELPSAFFEVLGAIFSVSVMLLWVVVAAGTLQRSWTGKMFYSPCLAEVEKAESARIVLAQDGGGPKEV
ncbi:Plasma membrane sulfite pump involved in sulfite metabolism [Elasticomyces elasticus]|nr:Plasma membrane sulfite pump involved in sulfite metabolism [Elasticomyces elasticus]KAK4971383.1 Plasma membrane sulfite pump involved in sulfite metabolism [Elasticomyces elasticus]